MRPGRDTRFAVALLGCALGLSLAARPLAAAEAGAAAPSTESRLSRCIPVEVRSIHGGRWLPNTRLARIENGRVPCIHVEDGTVASCLFSTANELASGNWLEGSEGGFAPIGQAVSLSGKPGGDYIVAARVDAENRVPCMETVGMDTAGWVDEGVELAISCVVEEAGQEWNAASVYGWFPLINFSNHEVCAANNPATHPHPDGLLPIRSYALPGSAVDNVFCYLGPGSALNDINGTERDETSNYFSGENYCHLIVNGGFEVPGAKRPATKSLPAPGIVNVKTIITWKPVNPNVAIANW